ncbi:MAG TPA: sigma-70 family RNA polymerase sigma factor [Actinomycetota bacterium]
MSEQEPEDRALVERYVAGDRSAFDAIVARHDRRVYAVALRMTGRREDALDVTQDVFVTAMRSLRTFRGDAQLTTWLHRVTVNACLDQARRAKRRRGIPLEVLGEQPASGPGPDERAESASRAAEVRRALARLTTDHRAVLVLHDLQDLDYAEVARILEVPVGTVKSRIHRARVELAGLLGHLRRTEPAAADEPLRDAP